MDDINVLLNQSVAAVELFFGITDEKVSDASSPLQQLTCPRLPWQLSTASKLIKTIILKKGFSVFTEFKTFVFTLFYTFYQPIYLL